MSIYKNIYSLNYKPSTHLSSRNNIIDILTIKEKTSIFESLKSFEIDSTFITAFKTGTEYPDDIFSNKLLFNYKVIKNHSSKEITFKDVIGGYESYSYKENINFKWNISDEKLKIENYNCLKATTFFAGRKWIAWFTEQIPIWDGPYKFYGLPGLILKLYDTEEEFIWEMIGIKSSNGFSIFEETILEAQGFPIYNTTKEKYNKRIIAYRKNPIGNYLDSFPNDEKDDNFMRNFREYEKKEKEFLLKNNNSIELNK